MLIIPNRVVVFVGRDLFSKKFNFKNFNFLISILLLKDEYVRTPTHPPFFILWPKSLSTICENEHESNNINGIEEIKILVGCTKFSVGSFSKFKRHMPTIMGQGAPAYCSA